MIKKTISDHEDLPSLPMGYLIRNCHGSRCCCTCRSLYVAVEPSSASGHQNSQPQALGQTSAAVLLQGYTLERLQITIVSTKSVRPFFQKQQSLHDGILNNGGRSFRTFYKGFQCSQEQNVANANQGANRSLVTVWKRCTANIL